MQQNQFKIQSIVKILICVLEIISNHLHIPYFDKYILYNTHTHTHSNDCN